MNPAKASRSCLPSCRSRYFPPSHPPVPVSRRCKQLLTRFSRPHPSGHQPRASPTPVSVSRLRSLVLADEAGGRGSRQVRSNGREGGNNVYALAGCGLKPGLPPPARGRGAIIVKNTTATASERADMARGHTATRRRHLAPCPGYFKTTTANLRLLSVLPSIRLR